MKKILIACMLFSAIVLTAKAVPALPGTARIQQPDGSWLTIRLVGDEYRHFNTTEDGYSIVTDTKGYYVYAELQDGQLVPTRQRAHDVQERSEKETVFLADRRKMLTPAMSRPMAAEQQAELSRRAKARAQRREPSYDYNKFKGLIILVEFNDKKFSRSDYKSLITNMVNKANYKGYSNSNYGRFTGSVRDYFYDNSDGMFAPQFDIAGPVSVDRSQFYPEGTKNATQLMNDVVDAADEIVDFSQYDGDNDGLVDMVYFIFAGIGANISGNDSKLIWPHAGAIYNENGSYSDWAVVKDGIMLWRYACSTELYGSSSWSVIDGIGTICHEFSHVLGLPDLYDTDYKENGQSNHPSLWSIMAGGSYQNYSRTPVGYTLYERYAVGFATPTTISAEGSYELPSVGSSNTGYRLDSRAKDEFFLVENRQKTDKWDLYLPGHGMLVYRVDSTNNRLWENNQVNINPRHNHFELIRAGGGQGAVDETDQVSATDADPFPGSKGVTELNNATTPANLLSWAGKESPFGLWNISETEDGLITFNVEDTQILRSLELPKQAAMGAGRTMKLRLEPTPSYIMPKDAVWTSSNPEVADVSNEGVVTSYSEGTTTITVTAVNKRQEELTASCEVMVEQRLQAADIAEFNAMETGTWADLKLTEAQVLMVYDGKVYLRDATGAVVMDNQSDGLNRNDMLNGYIYGRQNSQDLLPTLTLDEDESSFNVDITQGEEPAPIEIKVDSLTDRHYADLLTLKKTRIENVDGGMWAVGFNGRRIKLWNSFGVSGLKAPKTVANKRFDVTGILLTDSVDGELIDVLGLFGSPKSVSFDPNEEVQGISDATLTAADEPEALFTIDGRRLPTTSRPGIYILKQGNKTVKVVRK